MTPHILGLMLLTLSVLPVQPVPEMPSPYVRAEWSERWAVTEATGENGCKWDTRHFVLHRDSLKAETREEHGKACRVLTMTIIDPYTGRRETGPAGDFDIDHIVAVAEAHVSGGWRWSKERREAFYNDPLNLVATTAHQNRSKGDKDPGEWLPEVGRCDYARAWLAIKGRYGLAMDEAEVRGIARALGECR